MTQNWLVEKKVWELSQLGWLAGGYYTDWMSTDPHLTHQEVEAHLVFKLVCHSHHQAQ